MKSSKEGGTSPSQQWSSVSRDKWYLCFRKEICPCAEFDDGGTYCTSDECIREEDLNEIQ